eukprot:snap_masked-scaffold_12-processed-gene-9.15-mRNA-1 protein AED:1.00 eAED:1.00 QI:0/-1/0/0/-1/1/1/0/74
MQFDDVMNILNERNGCTKTENIFPILSERISDKANRRSQPSEVSRYSGRIPFPMLIFPGIIIDREKNIIYLFAT